MENLRVFGREPRNIREKAATYVNSELSQGKPAYKVLSLIRALPNPIAVDFNNVITNNINPMKLNPDAPKFLKDLRGIGSVFVVTTALNWESVQEFLGERGVWSPDMILITSPNYQFISDLQRDHPQGEKLRAEFQSTARELGWSADEDNLIMPPRYKRISPIFGKPFLVPIIDDSVEVIHKNPGMLGIHVQEWEPNYTDTGKKENDQENEDKLTLSDAVEVVRRHYASLGASSITSEAVK